MPASKRKRKHPAPRHLRRATADWFRRVCDDFALEEHHVRLLTGACEAWDRAAQAREILDAEGIVYRDKWNQAKAHPAVVIERDQKRLFCKMIEQLGIDAAEPEQAAARLHIRTR